MFKLIYSFNITYAYYVPGTVSGPEITSMNKMKEKNPTFMKLTYY